MSGPAVMACRNNKLLQLLFDGVSKRTMEDICGIADDLENSGALPEDTTTICNPQGDYSSDINQTTEFVNGQGQYSFLNNTSCYICNGYYGPCFEDPLCSTCHAFLYPNAVLNVEVPSMFEPSSDSDSGNEEPDDGQESLSTLDSADGPAPLMFEFEDAIRRLIPVGVETLALEIHKLSVFSPQLDQVNIELLPPEVLMHMFKYLDEISLWSIGQVCTRWREILFMCIKPERWRDFTNLRWPLLNITNQDQDWYEVYTSMMLSSCCLKCVKQMAAQELRSNMEENSWRRHRLRTELRAMRNDPLDGIDAKPLDNTCGHWQATIEGPAGSPYEGGLFFLYVQVPPTYPLNPPVVRFITKIFHPNVSRHGDIGIDSIHHNWSLALTISKLLISIQSLLTDPFCDVCMEPEIGQLYVKNRKRFEEEARLWTVRYAMHDMLPH